MIRVELGDANVDLGLDPRGSYPVDDLLNAVVRVLRAVGTEESAEAIDRLSGEALPPVAGSVRVHLDDLDPADGPGYVILEEHDLRLAARAKLAGWERMATPTDAVYGRGDTLEVVDEEGTGHPYLIDGIEPGGTASNIDGAIVLVLAPLE